MHEYQLYEEVRIHSRERTYQGPDNPVWNSRAYAGLIIGIVQATKKTTVYEVYELSGYCPIQCIDFCRSGYGDPTANSGSAFQFTMSPTRKKKIYTIEELLTHKDETIRNIVSKRRDDPSEAV